MDDEEEGDDFHQIKDVERGGDRDMDRDGRKQEVLSVSSSLLCC